MPRDFLTIAAIVIGAALFGWFSWMKTTRLMRNRALPADFAELERTYAKLSRFSTASMLGGVAAAFFLFGRLMTVLEHSSAPPWEYFVTAATAVIVCAYGPGMIGIASLLLLRQRGAWADYWRYEGFRTAPDPRLIPWMPRIFVSLLCLAAVVLAIVLLSAWIGA